MTVAQSLISMAVITAIVFGAWALVERWEDKPIAPWLVRLLDIPEEEDE